MFVRLHYSVLTCRHGQNLKNLFLLSVTPESISASRRCGSWKDGPAGRSNRPLKVPYKERFFLSDTLILLHRDSSSSDTLFKTKPVAAVSLSYSLPLLPAGLRRALDFVRLVSHDDVLLLHQSAAPPQHAVRAEGARTLIRGAVLSAARGVEAGRSGREAQALGDGVGDLQRAGADALS